MNLLPRVILCLLLSGIILPTAYAGLVFERTTANADIGLLGNNAVAYEGIATLFVYDGANALDYVAIRTGITSGAPAENYYAYIFDDSNATAPGTQVCKSNLLNLAGINSSSWDNNFTFSGCSPGNDTYWFALKTEANADTDYVVWRGFNGAPAHYSDTLSGNAYGPPGTFELDIRVFDLPASNTISTTAVGPPDGDHTANSSTTVLINYYYNDTLAVDASKVDCTLWYQTPATSGVYLNVSEDTSPTANVTENITNINAFGNETTYQWLVECGDGSTNDNTTARNLTIDRTNPVINIDGGDVAADNSTIRNRHLQNETVDFHIQVTDTYVYGVNVTAVLANGTKIYSNQTENIAGSVFDSNQTINLTAVGGVRGVLQTNITFVVNASDDHTAAWIPDYGYETTSNSLTFTTDKGVVCTLEASESNLKGINVTKLTDRYTWTFTKNNAKTEHALDVTCSEKLNYRGDLYPFPAFVVGDGWAHHWIDFNLGEGVTYSVVEKSPTRYTITATLPEPSDQATYSSIGGLNYAERRFVMEYTLRPATPSIQSDVVGITWIYTNWTASTGATNYGIYRDGVNVANTTNAFYNHTGLSDGTSYTVGVTGIFNLSDAFYENNTLSTTVKQTVFNGSLNAEVRNEVTNDVLSGPLIFINLIGTVNYTGNTTTGQLALVNISSDNYTVRHSSIGWGSRDQYLEIGENDSGSIILYLINDTIRDPGRVYVRDTQSDPVNGSVLKLLRYFDDENLYRTVQMSTTNDDGIAVMSAEAYTAWYKWIVENNGSTALTINIPEFLSEDDDNLWRRTFTINTGNDFWESYTSTTNDYHQVTFTNATRTLTYTFNDPDSLITQACIRARWANGTIWQTEGPQCLSASTGSINLVLPDVNRTFIWTSYYDTSTSYSSYTSGTGSVEYDTHIFNGLTGRQAGAFLATMLFIGAAALFAFNAVLGVIVVGVLFALLSIPSLPLLPFSMSAGIATATLAIGFAIYAMRRS